MLFKRAAQHILSFMPYSFFFLVSAIFNNECRHLMNTKLQSSDEKLCAAYTTECFETCGETLENLIGGYKITCKFYLNEPNKKV